MAERYDEWALSQLSIAYANYLWWANSGLSYTGGSIMLAACKTLAYRQNAASLVSCVVRSPLHKAHDQSCCGASRRKSERPYLDLSAALPLAVCAGH